MFISCITKFLKSTSVIRSTVVNDNANRWAFIIFQMHEQSIMASKISKPTYVLR